MLVENKEYFIGKWQERLESENSLVRYKVKQLGEIITSEGRISEFDIDLYFAMVEKVIFFLESG